MNKIVTLAGLSCKSAGRLTKSAGEGGVNLPADLVTVTNSASQQICQQKWGVKSASILVTVTKSAS